MERNLNELTIIELKAMAKEKGIKNYSTYNKAELVQLLTENEFESAVEDELEEAILPDEDYMSDEDAVDITFNLIRNTSSESVTYSSNTTMSQVLDDHNISRNSTVVISGEIITFNSLERTLESLGVTPGIDVVIVTKTANA